MKNMTDIFTNNTFRSFHRFVVLTMLAVTLALILPGTAARAEAATARKAVAYDVFYAVNEVRAQYGLKDLKWNRDLTACAEVRAKELRSFFSHTRPDDSAWYTVNPEIMYGENLMASPIDMEAHELVEYWMDSPSHRALILEGRFKTAGVAFYHVNGKDYWAFEFGY